MLCGYDVGPIVAVDEDDKSGAVVRCSVDTMSGQSLLRTRTIRAGPLSERPLINGVLGETVGGEEVLTARIQCWTNCCCG